MIITGIIFCLVSVLILYKRINYLIFGRRASGRIIGYGNYVEGMKGIDTYSYKVEYEYDNKGYVANSLESVQVSRGQIPNKNLHLSVTVCFKESKPEVITILEFKETTVLGSILFFVGIAIIVLSFFN